MLDTAPDTEEITVNNKKTKILCLRRTYFYFLI